VVSKAISEPKYLANRKVRMPLFVEAGRVLNADQLYRFTGAGVAVHSLGFAKATMLI
jgi:hypothetical protein